MKNTLISNCWISLLMLLLIGCKKEDEVEIVTVNVRVTYNNASVTNVDVGAAYSLDELDFNSFQQKEATNSGGEAIIKMPKADNLYFEVETFINGKPFYGKTHVSTLETGKEIPLQEIVLSEAQILPKQITQTKGQNPNTSYFDLLYQYDDQNKLVKIIRKNLGQGKFDEFCTFTYYADGKLQKISYNNTYVEFKHQPDMVVADYNYPAGISSRIVDSLYFWPNGTPLYLKSFDIDHPNLNTNFSFNYSGSNFLNRVTEFRASNQSYYWNYNFDYDYSQNPFYKDRNALLQIKYGFRPLFLDEWGGVTPRSLRTKDGSAYVHNSYTYFNNTPDSVSTKTGFNSTEWVKQKINYCWR